MIAFYLFLTAGLPIAVHYCHGQIKEIKILSRTIDSSEDMEMPASECCNLEIQKDCCSHEYYVFQLDIDEEVVSSEPINKLLIAVINNNHVNDATETIVVENNSYQFCDLPPPQNQPIWLMNCNFSLYG